MIYLKKFFLCLVIYILCVSSYIISSTNFSSNEKIIEKRNVKRSIKEINNFKYDKEIIDNLSTNIRKKRNIIKSQFKWTSPIIYNVHFKLNYELIKTAITAIARFTCLRFLDRRHVCRSQTGINFIDSKKCFADLGKLSRKGWQNIYIGKECNTLGGVVRLILRTLGVIYEHNRVDRNLFIKVYEQNIDETSKKYFQKHLGPEIEHLFVSYNYGSLMHFGMYEYSKNGFKTLAPRDHFYVNTVGQQDSLTFSDAKNINLHYCFPKCYEPIVCENFGYQAPKSCDKCVCIPGYEGDRCEKYTQSLEMCGSEIMIAKDKPEYYRITGKKYCIYHLKSRSKKKIQLVILKISMDPNYSSTCSINNALEVKYWIDKTVSGARFCYQKFPKVIKSHDNYIILQYKSIDPRSYVYFYYKEIP
ncbi:Astacin-like metalloendopeptidase [Strongyloides ratti]|uniref:Metalloendopeptidase n=1 Tax=Strongyloides ratti TaxID=34506 RepID=A0A090MZ34_STRRB|nr:Astacin-like metalloendopeptidase [Strongyloides ratti]CEF68239.1 Astacin-like metalloendopeptidase [Strongyloides ratti]